MPETYDGGIAEGENHDVAVEEESDGNVSRSNEFGHLLWGVGLGRLITFYECLSRVAALAAWSFPIAEIPQTHLFDADCAGDCCHGANRARHERRQGVGIVSKELDLPEDGWILGCWIGQCSS